MLQLRNWHATHRYQNFDRKQVEESTSRFLLLIDKQLTNQVAYFPEHFSILSSWVGHLQRKTYESKYFIRDKNQPTALANSSNDSRARRHNVEFECKYSKQNVHGKFHILSLEGKYVETSKHILKAYSAIEMSLNKEIHTWQVTELRCFRSDTQITAEIVQTYDL